MEATLQSFLLVLVSEMGDKTQLLALVLAARFRRPIPIFLGIFVATLLNHALASYLGVFFASSVSPDVLKWILAVSFIGVGLWMLIPDKPEILKESRRWGPFITTAILFFFAEMGDKTQLATLALGAKFAAPVAVTVGTTLAMLVADGLAVFFGHRFVDHVPMVWVHRVASVLFILFGLGIAVS